MDGVVTHLELFRGRRVFITGDTGFKGSWLSFWLHQLGADIVGYALPPERERDHFNLLGLGKSIHHIDNDIRDFSALFKAVHSFQPEFIFHLAAQPLVRLSYHEPKMTFDVNVGGTVNLLEAARSSQSLRALIFVSTDKCYKNKEWVWGYRESDELGGRDPYSASKAACEMVFASYLDSYFGVTRSIGAASVRAGNVIGGGDWALDRVVPDVIKSLQSRQPVLLRNPLSARPWQHVLEPLSGYLLLAEKLYKSPMEYSGAWNFGPGGKALHTVQELTEKIVSCWGEGKIETEIHDGAPHEAELLHLNCDKAQQMLGWTPRWDFDRSIQETVFWYKQLMAGTSASLLTSRQLQSYMDGLV